MIELTHDPIDVNRVLMAIQDPASGGIAIFMGVVRDNSAGNPVRMLEYHAYESMAIAKMRSLAETAVTEFQLRRVAIVHRLGELQIGEAAVITAVSAPHRSEAFRACRFLIDQLKQDVPIWKKECFADHVAWV